MSVSTYSGIKEVHHPHQRHMRKFSHQTMHIKKEYHVHEDYYLKSTFQFQYCLLHARPRKPWLRKTGCSIACKLDMTTYSPNTNMNFNWLTVLRFYLWRRPSGNWLSRLKSRLFIYHYQWPQFWQKSSVIPWALVTKAVKPNYSCLVFPFRPDHMSPSILECRSSSSTTWHIATRKFKANKPVGQNIKKLISRIRISFTDKCYASYRHRKRTRGEKKMTNQNQ